MKHVSMFEKKVRQESEKSQDVRVMAKPIIEYYISQKQYEKANAFVLGTKSYAVICEYLVTQSHVLLEEEKYMLCMECLLFVLEMGNKLSASMLRVTAEIFNKIHDELWDKCETELERRYLEREFYMTLLAYNENPMRHRTALVQCFFALKEKMESKKKMKVNSFGVFKVTVAADGKELKWRTKKGCELFAFLHQMQGEPVKRQVLMEVLWPNGIPKNAVTMLHNMIYNIRKELISYGLEDVIQYKDKMYALNMEWIQSDLAERRRLSEKCREAKFLEKYEQFFVNYSGKYLESIDNYWMIDLREFYDKEFIKGCMYFAEQYMACGKFETALQFLKNVIAVDNLTEKAEGKILLCYGNLGDRNKVEKEYQAFAKLIWKELHVEPCEELKQMYREALDGANRKNKKKSY